MGTTISPYLFFWQASQEVEDIRAVQERQPLTRKPGQAPDAFKRIRVDTWLGMAFSNLVAVAIMITTAATLHRTGVADIETSTQAAEALRPVAGVFAFAVFAVGIIGTGLLSVPVLAGSAAYALGEARRWPVGLARRPKQAKAFYATIAVAMLGGAALNFAPINPIKALFWSAVINGVVAVPVMAVMMLMGRNRKIMGEFVLGGWLLTVGWLATAVMGACVLGMAATVDSVGDTAVFSLAVTGVAIYVPPAGCAFPKNESRPAAGLGGDRRRYNRSSATTWTGASQREGRSPRHVDFRRHRRTSNLCWPIRVTSNWAGQASFVNLATGREFRQQMTSKCHRRTQCRSSIARNFGGEPTRLYGTILAVRISLAPDQQTTKGFA
jgi:hypothetical protein